MNLFTASLVVLAAAAAVDLRPASRAQSLTARVSRRSAVSDAVPPRASVQVNAAKLGHFLMSTFAIDIIIVLDSSGSIGSDGFLKAKQFMAEIVDLMPSTISPDNTRVACISYSSSDKIITEFDFLDHTDKRSVIKAIHQVHYEGGGTETTLALRRAQALFANSGRREAKKIIFLATDGQSYGESPVVPANEMKNSDKGGVQIEVVAVSQGVNVDEVEAIASSPAREHVYYVSDFSEATSITEAVRANMAS